MPRVSTQTAIAVACGATLLAIGALVLAKRNAPNAAKANKAKRPSTMSSDAASSTPAAAVAAASSPDSSAAPEAGKATISTAETVHVLKTNKTTGIKSSYYHFSSTPAEEAARYAPQLIDPSKPHDTAPMPTLLSTGAAPVSGASRWNAAGTWEDKDISEWAHQAFKDALTGFAVDSVAGKITGFERVSGDCTIIFSRGRKKHGYDVAALANFTASVGDKEIKGTLEFPEIADSCADEPWQCLVSIKDPSADTRKEGEQVYEAFKKAVPEMRKIIDAWVEELKKQE